MTRSPLIPTAILFGLVLATPALVGRRLTSPVSPLQAVDPLLVVLVVMSVLLGKAMFERDAVVDSNDLRSKPLQYSVARLVDHSLFGVGVRTQPQVTATGPLISKLSAPQPIEVVDASIASEASRWLANHADQAAFSADASTNPQRPAPVTIAEILEPDHEPVYSGATVEYTVERGDTWWSIAESALEDGRQWRLLLRLNEGRNVEPNHVLCDGDELRIGWSIVLPVSAFDAPLA